MTSETEEKNDFLPENAYLIVNSRIFPLDQAEITIGRGLGNHLVLNDSSVSRNHARVFLEEGRFVLEDLGSTNGTTVNGEVAEKRLLQSGDIVSVGEVTTLYVEYSTELLRKALDRTGFPVIEY